MSLVDLTDTAVFDAWLQADMRGFLGPRSNDEKLAESRDYQSDRRTTGVYDDELPGLSPVATAQSWITPLTLPGLVELPSWAISSITVAPTHRRRGIATAMLEAELRTARDLGVPLAVLTVSESTIYHRFGFGPATVLTTLEIDTKRVRWRGRDVAGRLSFVDDTEQFRATATSVLDRVRRAHVGEIAKSRYLADRLSGPLRTDEKKDAVRVVRFDDASGECQGFVTFTLTDHERDFASHTLAVQHLAAATDDAYLALWRFLVEHDLVGTVTTNTASDAEPLPLLVSDFRRVRQLERADHLWVRVLDVASALAGRRYERDCSLTLHVADPLDIAGGTWRIDVVDGIATVDAVDAEADATLAVTALGSLLLGGMRARDLALRGEIEGDVASVDELFRTIDPPYLGSWF